MTDDQIPSVPAASEPATWADVMTLNARVDDLCNKLDEVIELVKSIEAEAKPAIDALMANPMIKMMFGGK